MGDASPAPPLHPFAPSVGIPTANPTKSYWQTSHPNPYVHHRSTADLPSTASAIVIGTGISGTFATRTLLESIPSQSQTASPVILALDARTLCSGATGRNGGHCAPNLYEPATAESATFELANYRLLAGLVGTHGISCDFRALSNCHAFYTREHFDGARAEAEKRLREEPSLASELRVVDEPHILAQLRVPSAVGAIVHRQAASLSPYKLVTWLWADMLKRCEHHSPAVEGAAEGGSSAQSTQRRGPTLNLQTETAVSQIRPSATTPGHWTVVTTRGEVTTPTVIVATNAYTEHLLPQFSGLITPVRGQMSALVPPTTAPSPSPPLPTGSFLRLDNSYAFLGLQSQNRMQDDYLVQAPGGELMFGGGRGCSQNAGIGVWDDSDIDTTSARYLRRVLLRALDFSAPPASLPDNRLPPPESLAEQQRNNQQPPPPPPQQERVDELRALAEWTGIMGFSADDVPWVGPVPGMRGVFVAAGYTGHGMPNAALCGRYVGELGAIAAAEMAVGARDEREVKAVDGDGVAADRVKIPDSYRVTPERMARVRARARDGAGW